MKLTYILPLLAMAVIAVIMLVPGLGKAIAERAHAAVFQYMGKTGMVLGMAEINARGAAELAAGRKILFDSDGKSYMAVCEMPAVHAAANGDTAGTGIMIPKGARLLCPVTLSNAVGTASSTLAVGLRNWRTKVAIDATAIMAATSIAAAATAQVNTGTKLTGGQRYVLDQDAEIYFTFAGATPPANQPIRVEVPFIAA